MTLEELATRCKGTVSLEINPERFGHESRADYLQCTTREVKDSRGVTRIINAPNLYELQFYPDSMMGFYCVYGVSLDDVLEQATDILNGISS